MGSLVHSRECGEATAVSVTSFRLDLVAKIGRLCFQALEFAAPRTVAKYIFYCCRTRTRTYQFFFFND